MSNLQLVCWCPVVADFLSEKRNYLKCSKEIFLEISFQVKHEKCFIVMMFLLRMHFPSKQVFKRFVEFLKTFFENTFCFSSRESSINKNSIEFAHFHGSLVNGAQNVHFGKNLNFSTKEYGFSRSLMEQKSC